MQKNNLTIQSVKVGPERTNCYIVSLPDGETVAIDPGAEVEKITELLEKVNNLNLRYILLTHGHFDHVGAVDALLKLYPDTPIYLANEDVQLYEELPEQGIFVGRLVHPQHSEVEAVYGGEYLPFGELQIHVIATPGHSEGGVCYLVDDQLFSGDTLFYHTHGRVDLPHSDAGKMKESLRRLLSLPENTKVHPGHGKATTIAEERINNPYIKESFPH